MKVDFVLRRDAAQKGGGDIVQAEGYVAGLERRGFDVKFHSMGASLNVRPDAVVHLMNSARPFELLEAADHLAKRQIPYVVSPIHHSLADVKRMRAAETGEGFRSLAGRVLPEAGREYLATTARRRSCDSSGLGDLLRGAARDGAKAGRVHKAVGKVLDRATSVTLLSNTESRGLQRDTGWAAANGVLVPNGRPDCTRQQQIKPWSQRKNQIVVVGRIEPRKRPLDLALEANKIGARIIFIGAPNLTTGAYVAEFERIVDQTPNLSWIGKVDNSEVVAIMGESKVLVNGSWAEVQSLVDIEALSSGCYVFGSLTGSTYEHAPAFTRIFGHDSLGLMLSAAVEIQGEDDVDCEAIAGDYRWTWDEASEKLSQIYKTAIG